MLTTVTRRYEWDMAHRLPYHNGKCRRLHGHRYVLEIDVTGEVQPAMDGISSSGMVVDFDVIKQAIRETIGEWDHRCMLWDADPLLPLVLRPGVPVSEYGFFFVSFIPTAENMVDEVMRLLTAWFAAQCPYVKPTRVRIYETPDGWAEVRA